MTSWVRSMPRPPRCLARAKSTCSDPLPTHDTRCGFSTPDRFEFSVKVRDVAGKVCNLGCQRHTVQSSAHVGSACLKECAGDVLCTIKRARVLFRFRGVCQVLVVSSDAIASTLSVADAEESEDR